MHMSDTLLTPAVGASMLAVSSGFAVYAAAKLKKSPQTGRAALMGAAGAFVFAAQMINFPIPFTGSSGHIGGGILLAALLGPYAGFLTMAVILMVQALFFADGGLLAYGCNLLNMGMYTCFIAYPLIHQKIAKPGSAPRRHLLASVLSVTAGLQLGAFSVVLQTLFSGKSELPFATFALYMQPVHLAIGLMEGIVTGCVLYALSRTQTASAAHCEPLHGRALHTGRLIATLLSVSLLLGGIVAWNASSRPDGLEWSIEATAGTAGETEPALQSAQHDALAGIQQSTALLPDYAFSNAPETGWFQRAGTSVSGITGIALTLGTAALTGALLSRKRRSAHTMPAK